MRRLVVILVLLLALAAVTDRGAAAYAERRVAMKVQSAEQLSRPPGVTIHGFPFLTQAVRGRYSDIEVRVRGLQRGKLRVTRIDAHLRGVHLALSAAASGNVDAVPVDRADAVVLLSFADLEHATGRTLRIGHDGDRLTVSAFGLTVHSSVKIDGETLVVTAQDPAGAGRLDFTVPVRGLPFGVSLGTATVTAEGVRITASGERFVLKP